MKTSEMMTMEFHEKFGQPIGELPGPIPDDRLLLRLRLIAEEVTELLCAMTGVKHEFGLNATYQRQAREFVERLYENRGKPDLVEIADGACDSHVVISGTCIEFGIPEDDVFTVVHASNMAKAAGGTMKVLKPEDWEPPDVLGVLIGRRGSAGKITTDPNSDHESDTCPMCEARDGEKCGIVDTLVSLGSPGMICDCPREVVDP